MIGIIDYGASNLKSVKNAFDFLGYSSKIIRSENEFIGTERIVFPGVGSFGHAVKSLKTSGLFSSLRDWIRENKPYLGICLGFQLLFESSTESPGNKGFSYFKGRCKKFSAFKVPQIGWNSIQIIREIPLFETISCEEYFYFVHSYYVLPQDISLIIAKTNYGIEYTSAAGKGNIIGVQFHPEKSGKCGLKLLQNWIENC